MAVMLKRIRRVLIGALASGLLLLGVTAVSATVGVGPAGAIVANAPVVAIVPTADGGGYWMVGRDGGVFTFGDAPFYGSVGGAASAPIVGMAVDPQTGGYRMATSDGGLWWENSSSFGWVTGPLNAPVVGIASDDATGGYWMVASDGGVFAFNAPFLGSMGGTRLTKPIVGMAGTPDGNGYWLVAKDGGVFAFGDAAFYGSMGGTRLNQPVVGMAARRRPAATGLWPRMAASLPSTHRSTAPWEAAVSMPPSLAWRERPMAVAIGWWPRTAASSHSEMLPSWGRCQALVLRPPRNRRRHLEARPSCLRVAQTSQTRQSSPLLIRRGSSHGATTAQDFSAGRVTFRCMSSTPRECQSAWL